MDMQMTQVLDDEHDEKPAGDDDDNPQVGILRVGTTDHSIFKGFTKIGRSPALCKISVNDPTVSKVHAEIQAGSETAFISDVRSANGTKIKDVSLKPFFYYTINDGDTIYIGAVKAIFTTSKSTAHSPAVVPETPVASRRPSETNTGNASDFLFNNSSIYQSDDSVVPGTQRKDKSRLFQEPIVPVARRNGSDKVTALNFRNAGAVSSPASENFGKSEKTDRATKSQNVETDVHELETQLFETREETPKKSNLAGNKRDLADENVYDAETQIISSPTKNHGVAAEEKSNKSRTNDAAASCSRGYNSSSNFSRELQVSASPSPPDSPSAADHSVDMNQSQDLLELCESPLFAIKTKNPEDSKSRVTPIAIKGTANRREPIASSHVIAESDDESATDDDMDIGIVKARPEVVGAIPASNASDKIDDDSATDDEGKFETLAELSPPKETQKISPKASGAVAMNIFEAATQSMNGEAPGVSSEKKTRKMTLVSDAKTNIFEAGKQRRDQLRKTIALRCNNAGPNIFDAETQRADFDEETAVAAATSRGRENTVDGEPDVNIYDAATQRMDDDIPVVASAKKGRIPAKDLDADANIFEAATQQMDDDIPVVASAKKGRIPAKDLGADANIYEAATQQMDEEELTAIAKTRRDSPKDAEYDTDIDLLPTQVIDVRTSIPAARSRRSNARNCEKSPRSRADDGIHLAPTQIRSDTNDVADENDKERTPVASPSSVEKDATANRRTNRVSKLQVATSTPVSYSLKLKKPSAKKSPLLGAEDSVDTAGTAIRSDGTDVAGRSGKKRYVGKDENSRDENAGEKDNCPANLDESLMRNLGRILDEEATNGELTEEPTQLMTQNLVDILKPTQSFDSETKSRDSSDEIVGDVCEPPTPKRMKLASPRAAGFVDGRTMDGSRWSNAPPAASSTMREHENEDEKKTEDKDEESKLSDVKSKRVADESTDAESSSVGAARASSRISRATKSVTSRARAATKRGKESQEIEEILAATPKEIATPAISRQSFAKVNLVRMDDIDTGRANSDTVVEESPKINRKRRATMTAKELTPVPASPATAKSRRTISEGVENREAPKEQHKILITGLQEDHSKVVKKLGGTVVSEPSKATVLITDKVRRTYKFLCAIARGLRVVSINWLLESRKAARFLDCDDFILKDPAAEKQYKFQLEKSLQIARTKKFLEGYTMIITPKVNQPAVSELKAMIEASGGRVLTRAPGVRAWSSKTVIISREEDLTAINALLAKCPKTVKVTVQSTEFILSGILRQEVNLVEHQLDIS